MFTLTDVQLGADTQQIVQPDFAFAWSKLVAQRSANMSVYNTAVEACGNARLIAATVNQKYD